MHFHFIHIRHPLATLHSLFSNRFHTDHNNTMMVTKKLNNKVLLQKKKKKKKITFPKQCTDRNTSDTAVTDSALYSTVM